MDDELHSPGLSGYGAYALGRMSAQNERALDDFGKALQRRFRPAAPAVDVDALIAENEMLHRQLESARSELLALRSNYNELDAWATKTSLLLRKNGLVKG